MATHSSILAWRIPWTEEPGGLQSMGSQRVRYYWSKLATTHRDSNRHLNANFRCSFNHNSRKGEITQVSIEWMDKKYVVSHSMQCYSVIEGNEILIPWTLKTCKMKYARHKRTDTVWFRSSEVSRIVKFVETESRGDVTLAWRWGRKMESYCLMSTQVLFGDDKQSFRNRWWWWLYSLVNAQNQWSVYFKRVNFIGGKLYLDKSIFKNCL